MTYGEIAQALGISPDSARNLVRRKCWNRRPGNDGLARIDVPIEHLKRSKNSSPPEGGTDTPAKVPTSGSIGEGAPNFILSLLMGHLERREREIDQLQEQLEAARDRASDRDGIATQLATLREVLEELRTEKEHWREHAERLSAALAPRSRRLRWFWGIGKAVEQADLAKRSAREAAQDAGLLRGTDTPSQPASQPELRPDTTANESSSLLVSAGHPITVSELARAVERLNREIENQSAHKKILA